MRLSSITPLTLAAMGTLLIVVACSPNNNGKLKITEQKPSDFQKAVQACTDSLRASESHAINKHKVAVCEYSVDATSGAVDTKLTAHTHGVSYSVEPATDSRGHSLNQVRFKHEIELDPTTKVDTKELKALEVAVNNDCRADIAGIFSRSRPGASMSLDLTIKVDGAEATLDDASLVPASDAPDEILYVARAQEADGTSWSLVQLPNQPKFYPLAKNADKIDCSTADKSEKDKRDCINKKRHGITRPFCAALAKRIGNLMGIVDVVKEDSQCGAKQPADEAVKADAVAPTATPNSIKPVQMTVETTDGKTDGKADGKSDAQTDGAKQPPTPSADDSSFAKPSGTDDDFLDKSTLNKKDLVTILSPASPACKNLKQ